MIISYFNLDIQWINFKWYRYANIYLVDKYYMDDSLGWFHIRFFLEIVFVVYADSSMSGCSLHKLVSAYY